MVCCWQGSLCHQQTQHTSRYTPLDPSFISSGIKDKFFQSVSHESPFLTKLKEMIIVINLLYLCPEQLALGNCTTHKAYLQIAQSKKCFLFLFSLNRSGLCYFTRVKRSTTCTNQWKREWITRPSALQKHAVALTLKSSPMTRLNDVMYFHSLVSMWFVTGSVPNQILVTSAAYSLRCRLNLACAAQRGRVGHLAVVLVGSRTRWGFTNPGSVFWNDPW